MGVAMAFVFMVVGLFLIYLEFFAPGGILGAIGGVLLVGSLGVLFWQMGAFPWGVGALVFSAVLLVVVVRLALWKLKRSGKNHTFYAPSSQEGYQASAYDREVIGKKGAAVTDLKPAGRVLINEEWHQAVSEGEYIHKGEPILVLRGEGARLIVRKQSQKEKE